MRRELRLGVLKSGDGWKGCQGRVGSGWVGGFSVPEIGFGIPGL